MAERPDPEDLIPQFEGDARGESATEDATNGRAQHHGDAQHGALLRELHDIVTCFGSRRSELPPDEAAIQSCDLIWRDETLALYLGTLDAAVGVAGTVAALEKSACSSAQHATGSRQPQAGAIESASDIPDLMADIGRRMAGNRRAITPPPRLVDGKLVYAENQVEQKGSSKTGDSPRSQYDGSKMGSRTTAPAPYPLRGVINACAFDKHFLRTNGCLKPETVNAYISDTASFYRKKCAIPGYLELRAVDKESYDIGKHFPEVCAFVDGLKKRGQEENTELNGQAENTKVKDDHSSSPIAIYVHCVVGSNRSASLVCALLMWLNGWTAKEAIAVVASRRRCPILRNTAFRERLVEWEKRGVEVGPEEGRSRELEAREAGGRKPDEDGRPTDGQWGRVCLEV